MAAFHWFFPTWLEFWAFLSSLLGVWLMTRQTLLAWPVGLVSVALYTVFFFRGHLFADAALQVFFAALLLYGWWHWLHPRAGQAELPVTRLAASEARACWLAGAVALACVFALNYGYRHHAGLLLQPVDYVITFFDSLTAAMSLIAQWMQARKKLANWPLWIMTDVLYVAIYLYKDWKATAVLYALFILLAWLGWREWRASFNTSHLNTGQPQQA